MDNEGVLRSEEFLESFTSLIQRSSRSYSADPFRLPRTNFWTDFVCMAAHVSASDPSGSALGASRLIDYTYIHTAEYFEGAGRLKELY